MHGTVWSLLPFGVVLAVAVLTRQVLAGLLAGLLAGAFMLHPAPLAGVEEALRLLLSQLAIADNIRLILFLWAFGAFVGLVRATGGVTGFARWMESRARSVRSGMAWTWLSCAFTFMAPDFRILTVAPMMEDVFRRLKVPTDRLAVLIEATATPLTAVIPIGTVFVGYMISLVATEDQHHGLEIVPLNLILRSIPFNFVAWVMLAFAFYQSFWAPRRGEGAAAVAAGEAEEAPGPARAVFAETAAELAPRLPAFGPGAGGDRTAPGPGPAAVSPTADGPTAGDTAVPDPLNLLVPLAALLVLTLFLTWWSGRAAGRSFLGALTQADAGHAMLVALFITLVGSSLWYALRGQPLERITNGLLAGGNDMMAVNILLVLVWSVTEASRALGFTGFITDMVIRLVSPAFTAPILFAFGCAVAYVIGSTFGAWGLLLPMGYSLAAAGHVSLPLIAGAVFAGGTFGGFASPFSDGTVAMATVMKLPVLEYSRAKLKFGLVAALVSLVLYAAAGWLLHG